jgi:hypothetical protein
MPGTFLFGCGVHGWWDGVDAGKGCFQGITATQPQCGFQEAAMTCTNCAAPKHHVDGHARNIVKQL